MSANQQQQQIEQSFTHLIQAVDKLRSNVNQTQTAFNASRQEQDINHSQTRAIHGSFSSTRSPSTLSLQSERPQVSVNDYLTNSFPTIRGRRKRVSFLYVFWISWRQLIEQNSVCLLLSLRDESEKEQIIFRGWQRGKILSWSRIKKIKNDCDVSWRGSFMLLLLFILHCIDWRASVCIFVLLQKTGVVWWLDTSGGRGP